MENKDVQKIVKMTIQYAKEIIKPGMSLIDLRNDLEKKMLELGADSFWYWDVGAFIFSGDETNVSISGKHYVTANKTIQNNDIITIDLSPQNNNVWGDYARTIIIENGIVVDCVENIENEEWKKGLQMEDRLHQELLKYVTVETTFEDLYFHMNHFFGNIQLLSQTGNAKIAGTSAIDKFFVSTYLVKRQVLTAFHTGSVHYAFTTFALYTAQSKASNS